MEIEGFGPVGAVFTDSAKDELNPWRMPGMDGLQASRQITIDETLRQQPTIVLVTAFGHEEVREESERLSLDGFLVKPVTKSMIVNPRVNVFAETHAVSSVPPSTNKRNRPLRGARLLLTEDNEINQQIAVELLEGAAATVQIANHGREAVKGLFDGPPPPPFDAVLMDLQMPIRDGFETCCRLKASPEWRDIPGIFLTAKPATADIVQ